MVSGLDDSEVKYGLNVQSVLATAFFPTLNLLFSYREAGQPGKLVVRDSNKRDWS